MPEVPPIFNVALVNCVKFPVPDKAVVAVIIPSLVSTAGLVTVSNVAHVKVPVFVYEFVNVVVGIEIALAPPIVLAAPENVCVPVLAVYVPLFVRFPAIAITAFPFSVNVPPVLIVTSDPKVSASFTFSEKTAPLFIVTAPVKVLEPVVEVIDNVPLVPPPTVVAPETFNTTVPNVKFELFPIDNEPQLSVPVPVTVPVLDAVLFETAPVTASVTPVIVNVFVVVNVNEARAFAGATVRRGALEPVGIVTASPVAEPGFPFGVQFVTVAQAVLVPPVHV